MNFEDLPNALLIEDDTEDRLKIRLQLELMGFVVYDTPTKQEAEELFTSATTASCCMRAR